jgi:hypothetical protein
MRFEPKMQVSAREKTVHALDRSATVTGTSDITYKMFAYKLLTDRKEIIFTHQKRA